MSFSLWCVPPSPPPLSPGGALQEAASCTTALTVFPESSVFPELNISPESSVFPGSSVVSPESSVLSGNGVRASTDAHRSTQNNDSHTHTPASSCVCDCGSAIVREKSEEEEGYIYVHNYTPAPTHTWHCSQWSRCDAGSKSLASFVKNRHTTLYPLCVWSSVCKCVYGQAICSNTL